MTTLLWLTERAMASAHGAARAPWRSEDLSRADLGDVHQVCVGPLRSRAGAVGVVLGSIGPGLARNREAWALVISRDHAPHHAQERKHALSDPHRAPRRCRIDQMRRRYALAGPLEH